MKIICLTIAILFSSWAQATVYKWTDEYGNIHYSDRPRDAGDSKQMPVDTSTTTSTVGGDVSREEKRQKLLNALEEDRIEKQEQRAKNAEQRERNRTRCNWLKDKRRNLNRASRVYTLDRDGNRVYQSDDQRKQTEANLQREINQYCR